MEKNDPYHNLAIIPDSRPAVPDFGQDVLFFQKIIGKEKLQSLLVDRDDVSIQ